MGKDMVSLTIEGEVRQYPAGTSFLAISQEYQEKYPDDIVLVVYNNRLRELNKTAQRDGTLSFVTTADKTGKKTYRRSVTLLMPEGGLQSLGKRTYQRPCTLFHRSGILLRAA